MLVLSDWRLHQLFSHHGGHALLMVLLNKSSASVQAQVRDTLGTVSKGTAGSSPSVCFALCASLCVCVCVCVCECMHICVCLCKCTCMHSGVCACTHVGVVTSAPCCTENIFWRSHPVLTPFPQVCHSCLQIHHISSHGPVSGFGLAVRH